MLRARALIVLPLAALLAVGAIRAMTFVAPSSHALRALDPTFGSHPDALINRAMGEIGTAAARGGTVPPTARAAIASAARKAPLAPDPFLVEGTIAAMAGDPSRAERLFLAARTRNPRSQGARYFLADRYLKTNRILPGLVEMGALARLSNRAASRPLIPALAAYARTPSALPELRRFFITATETRDQTLALLAEDARNAPLILSLAPRSLRGAPQPEWHGRLIQSLITAGDYAGAEALWGKVAGVASRGPLYNPQFRDVPAPPPFNWQYASGNSGVAEPSDRGLDVIYYGRDEVVLATQMLRLAPGGYRLAMRVDGPSRASGLAWNILCVPGKGALLNLPLGTIGRGSISGAFAVPATGCPAQTIELRGRPGESSETAQLTVLDLKLEPLAAGR